MKRDLQKRHTQKSDPTIMPEFYTLALRRVNSHGSGVRYVERDLQKKPIECVKRDLHTRAGKTIFKKRDLQRRPTEKMKRDLRRTDTFKGSLEVSTSEGRLAKETYKRDLQKKPAKKTYKGNEKRPTTHDI